MKDTKWYVIRTATNKEKKCKELLDFEINARGFNNNVSEVIIPMEKAYHIRNGKKIATERNHYPGYIMVEMQPIMIGEMNNLLKGVNYVIGFLGGKSPIALRPNEVTRMLGKIDELASAEESVIEQYFIGETVKLIDGPFTTFIGKITEVNQERMKLKLNVKIFGRETPVDVNYAQVTKDE